MRMEFDESEWLIQVKEEAQEESYDLTTPCIFRVPSSLLRENEAAYVPEIISLGPYHFGKPELRGMEKYKSQAVRSIRRRIPDNHFSSMVNRMMSMEHQIRACYDKEIEYSTEVLCWMMARDASFLLEFFRNYISRLPGQDSKASTPVFEGFHPVFNPESDSIMVITILKDVMKLENQIPLFVLEEVLALEIKYYTAEELDWLIKMVLGSIYRPFDLFFFSRAPSRHILEMYHHTCFAKDFDLKSENSSGTGLSLPDPSCDRLRLPSAVKLKIVGVKFKLDDTDKFITDAHVMDSVKFDNKTCVLSLPFFILDVESEVFIRNLIALEMCSPRYKVKIFSEYAQFMDDLIQSEGDVAVMKENGIFTGNLRNYERLASLWSSSNLMPSLSQHTSIVQTRENLHRFYGKKWKTNCKIIWNEFCKAYGLQPWLVLGGVGAAIILILTLFQVVCLFATCQ